MSPLDPKIYQDFVSKRKRELREESGIPRNLLKYSWNDYLIDRIKKDDDPFSEEITASRKLAKQLCLGYSVNLGNIKRDKTGTSLLILGKRGSGKSVLGTLILRDSINKIMEPVLYISFGQFVLESNTVAFEQQRIDIEEKYVAPEILMIDEIERGYKLSDRAKNYFFLILSKRSEYNKPTILTSSIIVENELEFEIGLPAFRVITDKEKYFNPIKIISPENEDDLSVIFSSTSIFSPSKIRVFLKEKVEEKEGDILRSGDSKKNKESVKITSQELLSIIKRSKLKKL